MGICVQRDLYADLRRIEERGKKTKKEKAGILSSLFGRKAETEKDSELV